MLSSSASGTSTAGEPVMVVTVAAVVPGEIQTVLDVHGKTIPRDDVVVSPEVGGSAVLEVLAEEGVYVEKGQILARLDTARLQYSLDSLTADLAMAKEEFNRVQSIPAAGAISKDEAGRRRASYMALKAQVADAALQLEKAVILAPVAGLIYERTVSIGEISQIGQSFFKIAANAEIELEVAVPEAYAPVITSKTKVEAALSGDESTSPAAIRIISPRIDKKTRTAQVRLVFTSQFCMPVGTFCSAKFWLPAQRGLVVPNTAVQQDTTGTFVWVVQENDSVTRKNIRVAVRDGSKAVIEGVDEGAVVVARAGAFLQEGDRVKRAGDGA